MGSPTEPTTTFSVSTPKPKEVKTTKISTDQRKRIDEDYQIAEHLSEEEKINIEGLREFYRLRKKWSKFLLWAIGVVIGFQIVLTFFIGMGWLDFTKYKIVLGIIVGQNFAQIIGLALIVVNFLFKNPYHQIPGLSKKQ